MDKDTAPFRKTKLNKASKSQQEISASPSELQAIKSRNKKWRKDQDQRPGAGNKGSKYTSNKTHYSPTDPDARISVKPGKSRKLNYMSQLSVDTGHHVITDIKAYHADGKDSQCLPDICNRLEKRLHKEGLLWHNCVADTGYSSGENYAFLEQKRLRSYTPPHGTYKGGQMDLNITKGKIIIYVHKEKSFPLKRCFMRKRIILKRRNIEH
ncbi:MAG: transposase [Flavobacteriaceae bacterium]